jgi:hypothetical protein
MPPSNMHLYHHIIQLSFRHIDLHFPVHQVDVESSSDCDAVCIRPEDVANHLPVGEGVIANSFAHATGHFVRQTNQELPSRICVELRVNVPFYLRLVPDTELLTSSVDFTKEGVHVRRTVEVTPEDLSVLGIVATCEVLFCSVVGYWDADRCHSHGVASPVMFLLVVPVASPAESTGVIVVITKIGHVVESVGVDILPPLIIVGSQVSHVLLIEESIANPEEERIVEAGIQRTKVASNIPHIPIEDLSDCVDP